MKALGLVRARRTKFSVGFDAPSQVAHGRLIEQPYPLRWAFQARGLRRGGGYWPSSMSILERPPAKAALWGIGLVYDLDLDLAHSGAAYSFSGRY
jgi:hypothetical protein